MTFVLALAFLRFHPGRSLVPGRAAALILAVPGARRALRDAAGRGLTARAGAGATVLAVTPDHALLPRVVRVVDVVLLRAPA